MIPSYRRKPRCQKQRSARGAVIVEAVFMISLLVIMTFGGISFSRHILKQQQVIAAIAGILPQTIRTVSAVYSGSAPITPAELSALIQQEASIALRYSHLLPSHAPDSAVSITSVACQKYDEQFAAVMTLQSCDFRRATGNRSDRIVINVLVAPTERGFLGITLPSHRMQFSYPFPVAA